jgi:hypothetical protein
VDVVADDGRRDDVVGALQDQRGGVDLAEVVAVVRHEAHVRELLGYLGIGGTEAVGQLGAQLGPVRVAHDHRGHRARPAQVVAVQRLQHGLDVAGVEAPDVVAVVDVARRRPDQDELREPLRLLDRGEDADRRADRVADEDDIPQVQLVDDLEDVLGITVEGGVPLLVVGAEVGPAGADVVEEHHPMGVQERGRDGAPHVLVAAVAVREHHRLALCPAGDRYRVPLYGRHLTLTTGSPYDSAPSRTSARVSVFHVRHRLR